MKSYVELTRVTAGGYVKLTRVTAGGLWWEGETNA